jgi:hypothetical protein
VSTDLAIAEENARFLLEQRLAAVANGDRSGGIFFGIFRQYRTLALCKLLGEADVDAFVQLLGVSARARLEFLRALAGGYREADERVLCLSKDRGFECALAAGDVAGARAITELSPLEYREPVEYREDYLFALIQRQVLLRALQAPALDVAPLLRELAAEAPDAPALLIARGLQEASSQPLAEGLGALLQGRKQRFKQLRARSDSPRELLLTEGAVSVEGLALLRLAELVGVPIEEPLPLIPALARVPVWPPGKQAGDWRSPP